MSPAGKHERNPSHLRESKPSWSMICNWLDSRDPYTQRQQLGLRPRVLFLVLVSESPKPSCIRQRLIKGLPKVTRVCFFIFWLVLVSLGENWPQYLQALRFIKENQFLGPFSGLRKENTEVFKSMEIELWQSFEWVIEYPGMEKERMKKWETGGGSLPPVLEWPR